MPATIRPESFIQAKQPSKKRKMKVKKVPREGHFVSASELLSLSAPVMNHGTRLKRIKLAVEYELVDRPANDPSEIAIMNRIDWVILNKLKSLSHPHPPTSPHVSKASLIDSPRDKPRSIPGIGKRDAPGGRNNHSFLFEDRFVLSGLLIKLGAFTVPSNN